MTPRLRFAALALLLLCSLPAAAPAREAVPPPGERPDDPSLGMEFVPLPGGVYTRGDAAGLGRENERPAHPVRLSPFSIGKTEVTRRQFARFVEETGYRTAAEVRGWVADVDPRMGTVLRIEGVSWLDPGIPQGEDDPVVWVDWNDATAYAKWLAAATGRGYRLPTEAEWEYAARSGGKGERFAGTDRPEELPRFAWIAANSGGATHPAGTREPNGAGILDMNGNVWEWCLDAFLDYAPSREPFADPLGTGTEVRTLRGGSWRTGPEVANNTYRNGYRPDYSHSSIGFRLVRDGAGSAAPPASPEPPPPPKEERPAPRRGGDGSI